MHSLTGCCLSVVQQLVTLYELAYMSRASDEDRRSVTRTRDSVKMLVITGTPAPTTHFALITIVAVSRPSVSVINNAL